MYSEYSKVRDAVSKILHLDVRSQVMFKPLFVALRHYMNHHPEEKKTTIKKTYRNTQEEVRFAGRKEPNVGITFPHIQRLRASKTTVRGHTHGVCTRYVSV